MADVSVNSSASPSELDVSAAIDGAAPADGASSGEGPANEAADAAAAGVSSKRRRIVRLPARPSAAAAPSPPQPSEAETGGGSSAASAAQASPSPSPSPTGSSHTVQPARRSAVTGQSLKPQVPVVVRPRTIKLPSSKSALQSDLMAGLLTELLDEAGDSEEEAAGADTSAAADTASDTASGGDADGDSIERLKPNTNFLTRLVSSTQRSNARIIAEATGVPQAKRKAKGTQLLSKTYVKRRRRGVALINGLALKYGIKIRVLPDDDKAKVCGECGAMLNVAGRAMPTRPASAAKAPATAAQTAATPATVAVATTAPEPDASNGEAGVGVAAGDGVDSDGPAATLRRPPRLFAEGMLLPHPGIGSPGPPIKSSKSSAARSAAKVPLTTKASLRTTRGRGAGAAATPGAADTPPPRPTPAASGVRNRRASRGLNRQTLNLFKACLSELRAASAPGNANDAGAGARGGRPRVGASTTAGATTARAKRKRPSPEPADATTGVAAGDTAVAEPVMGPASSPATSQHVDASDAAVNAGTNADGAKARRRPRPPFGLFMSAMRGLGTSSRARGGAAAGAGAGRGRAGARAGRGADGSAASGAAATRTATGRIALTTKRRRR